MANKKSIYIGSSLALAAAPLVALLDGESGAANAMGDRYLELLRRSRPQFTLEEWAAICDENNGIWSAAFTHEVPMLAMVESSTAEKHGTDAGDINAIIAAMPFAEKLSAIDIIERFWARAADTRKPAAILQDIFKELDHAPGY